MFSCMRNAKYKEIESEKFGGNREQRHQCVRDGERAAVEGQRGEEEGKEKIPKIVKI